MKSRIRNVIDDKYINNFANYSEECFTQIYRALYGDAMLVPLGGGQTWLP